LNSRTTERFRRAFGDLEPEVQRRARWAYALFRENPRHPSLRLERIHATRPIYSARVGLGHRALGALEGDVVIWFWIGTHGDYERMLRDM